MALALATRAMDAWANAIAAGAIVLARVPDALTRVPDVITRVPDTISRVPNAFAHGFPISAFPPSAFGLFLQLPTAICHLQIDFDAAIIPAHNRRRSNNRVSP